MNELNDNSTNLRIEKRLRTVFAAPGLLILSKMMELVQKVPKSQFLFYRDTPA